VPPRPKRSAPDCQLSARDRMVLKSWQTGACRKVSLASGRAGQLVPAPRPPQPARPEARTARPPRPTNRDPASYDSLRSVCVMKDASDSQPQEQLYVAAQRPHRRPLTQDPRCWRPLNITASCGREPVAPVTLTACGPAALTLAPRRTRSARASRSSHPSRHTPHSASLFSLAGSQPTHPRGERWPPPPQGAALRGRAASAAPRFATSSRRGTEARRRCRHRRRHPRPHRPSARPQADSDRAASPAASQPGARIAGG